MPGQSAQGRVPSKLPAKARTPRPSGAGALSTSRSTSVECSSAAGSAASGAAVGAGVAALSGAAASVEGLQPARAIAAASRVAVNRVRFVIGCSIGGFAGKVCLDGSVARGLALAAEDAAEQAAQDLAAHLAAHGARGLLGHGLDHALA